MNNNQKKVISIISASIIVFTSTSIVNAGVVVDNGNYYSGNEYSLRRATSYNTDNYSNNNTHEEANDNSTNDNNQYSQSDSSHNTSTPESANSTSNYYVSPYSYYKYGSNSYSLSGARSYSINNNTSTNNANTSNSASLSEATKTTTLQSSESQSSNEIINNLPKFEVSQEVQTLLSLINKDRVAEGLKPLALDEELSKIAQYKSQDMYDYSYFSHVSPNFGKTSSLIRESGINYFAYGENIGRTYSVYRAHNGFMNSEGHRANIMSPRFTHIGIGIVGNYYTEVFIGK